MLQNSQSPAQTKNERTHTTAEEAGFSRKTIALFNAKKSLNTLCIELGRVSTAEGFDGERAAFDSADGLFRHIDGLLADSLNDDCANDTAARKVFLTPKTA